MRTRTDYKIHGEKYGSLHKTKYVLLTEDAENLISGKSNRTRPKLKPREEKSNRRPEVEPNH
ncbi:hypothetical protein, partial [Sporolactobacillus nakayamae]|uniref:hypothetical protein n=1 Tax=Sporolactobacillus nakayamae TaxID=269670 RepID=UPI001C43094B